MNQAECDRSCLAEEKEPARIPGVWVTDPNQSMREAIGNLLRYSPEFRCVGTDSDGSEALNFIRTCELDLALVANGSLASSLAERLPIWSLISLRRRSASLRSLVLSDRRNCLPPFFTKA